MPRQKALRASCSEDMELAVVMVILLCRLYAARAVMLHDPIVRYGRGGEVARV